MAGGILQLEAYGAQDIYLTHNPEITFFKIVYRRHTNFSMETFEHSFVDSPSFGTSNSIEINRIGDLINQMYLKVTINQVILDTPQAKFAWVTRLGHALVRSIEIKIGGVSIDEHTGTWLDIWYELSRSGYHDRGYNAMIANIPSMTAYNNSTKPEYTLFIPLIFWFNRYMGLALPTIAIQYHRIRLNVKFEQINKLIVTNTSFNTTSINALTMTNVSLLINHVFLDEVERNHFAYKNHEYLIEQIQFTGEESTSLITRSKLHFNHPTKELIWAVKNGNYTNSKKFLCYTHEQDWTQTILDCSKQLLKDSMTYTTQPLQPPWEQFPPQTTSKTSNNKITVINNSLTKTLSLNTSPLILTSSPSTNLLNKITATVTISDDDTILITDLQTTINIADISIPTSQYTDTRIRSDDVTINMFSNYGLLIDGTINPVDYAKLEFNDYERFIKRDKTFYGLLQPNIHHSNAPKNGINLYSFATEPEKHQPSGTANLSKIENIIFTLWLNDNIVNLDSRLFIFGYSYNVLRVRDGLAGISYNG